MEISVQQEAWEKFMAQEGILAQLLNNALTKINSALKTQVDGLKLVQILIEICKKYVSGEMAGLEAVEAFIDSLIEGEV